MSQLIVIPREMHKVAEFSLKVKYRKPGNVIEYIPVEFEIFACGECFKALPLQGDQATILANLPSELLFRITNNKVYSYNSETQEIAEEIGNVLIKMDKVEMHHTNCTETTSSK